MVKLFQWNSNSTGNKMPSNSSLNKSKQHKRKRKQEKAVFYSASIPIIYYHLPYKWSRKINRISFTNDLSFIYIHSTVKDIAKCIHPLTQRGGNKIQKHIGKNLIPIGMLLFMNPCSSSIKWLRDFILPTSIHSFSERVAFNYFPLNSILTFQNQRHFLIQKIVY